MNIRSCLQILLSASILLISLGAAETERVSVVDLRKKAQQLSRDGNHKEALEVYSQLSLDTRNNAQRVGFDLDQAVSCYIRLNRVSEIDSFRERVIATHSENWRLLERVALSYYNTQHYGYIVAGEFTRGHHRGGGKYVNSAERDRIRALQLLVQGHKKARNAADKTSLANFYLSFARVLIGYRGHAEAWRLQYLSDFTELPDYDDAHRYGYYGGGRGAPVDANGDPVFHELPSKYEDAQSDGQRWRWMLNTATQLNPSLANDINTRWATFLYNQFGTQTMANRGWNFGRGESDDEDESGTYALHTLGKSETIAKLATGVKRFDLPQEQNFISLYQRIADNGKSHYGEQALNKLATIFENRRQYETAARYWKRSITDYKANSRDWKRKRLDQIQKTWGQFEPVMNHPAGEDATVDYKFRNGRHVSFTAHRILVDKLLTDVKDYLKSNPGKLNWDKMNIGNIGYMLVQKEQTKYIGDVVAEWELDVAPPARHFDKRITVKTPLRKAGAYLLTARMRDGNISRIIIWLTDTAIVKKRLSDGAMLYVADAVSGKPLPRMNLEFFGYRQESVKWQKALGLGRHHNVLTTNFAEYTDENGQVFITSKDMDRHYRWLITAREEGKELTDGNRLAYLGFSSIWYSTYQDQEYNQTKVFAITDRPVYRPNQTVKFKLWVRHAKYDQADTSTFANRSFTVRIFNPKNEKVYEKSLRTDTYGGLDDEFALPNDATLGMYRIFIPGLSYNTASFRVEEYKKPEFEVKIDAPSDPIMLGEKISVKVTAKYYFGAPVTEAKVKYKVLRSNHDANWYPVGPWDWFYGPGYWWFAYDYNWYPGWHNWGYIRPRAWWWPVRHTPPEVVAEAETHIGEDGTITIDIDTGMAKELQGDTDHRYEITVEVTDQSRRTIVGKGTVLVARKPFKVYAWVDRGHYRAGDVIHANFSARTLDSKPVQGRGILYLKSIRYVNNEPVESIVQTWKLDTDVEGKSDIQIQASEPGQYRLSYTVTDKKGHAIEGAYVFCITGEGFDGKRFRFNDIELIPDKKEYKPGEKVRLMINTARRDSTVVLFLRPANGVYLKPRIIRIRGKSTIEEIDVIKKDMPNFFIEAFTVSDGRVYSDTREIVVPPEKRVLDVEVLLSSDTYKPGEKAKVTIKLTDIFGKPFVGSTVMSVYDKSVEYISGGSNVQEIRAFFWKWRRRHNSRTESNLGRYFRNLLKRGEIAMQNLGVFGYMVADEVSPNGAIHVGRAGTIDQSLRSSVRRGSRMRAMPAGVVMEMDDSDSIMEEKEGPGVGGGGSAQPDMAQPTVRKEFADTAFWTASLMTDKNGVATVEFDMPENLTTWKFRTWAMGHGTVVGQGTAEAVTTKNLLIRLQSPRFFIEKDEVVLSANIHNYLDSAKTVLAILELDGNCIEPMGDTAQNVRVKANGEKRVDWRVKVVREGEVTIRMKALTDEESDAMELSFPVYVHGMLKTDSFSGVIRPDQKNAFITIDVPKERRIEQSRIELRYSPTLAGALVDALPYLVEYPYGCTEQTLNRFLPTVITQKILRDMGVDLDAVAKKRTNLNAQEIGDDVERAKQWKRWDRNPVFDSETVDDMVKQGLKRLTSMQLSDGGWGWFSGWGERSYPHTTAYIVHGLQTARQNGVAVVPGVLSRGTRWLENYQAKELKRLKNAEKKKERRPWKSHADNMDAFVYMVLADANKQSADMRKFLYRDRTRLSIYGKAMFGLALHKQGHKEELAMIMRNIEQFLVRDDENQTAYLNLQNGHYWWYWYGSEYEAHAYYLKLLAAVNPKSEDAAGLVKYLLNNRKHATYWNSTRDTALCVEAMADYLRESGEDKPDMTIEILVDGKKKKEVRITADNLFTFDNKLVLSGRAVKSGKHRIEIRRKGKGPVYFNAYLTNFTLEDFITRAGLEIKVNRKYYKLDRVAKTIKAEGARGQVTDQKVEKYKRRELKNLSTLKSGDLVEIELEIDSKNDYEYIIFEDMKAAGFEPVDVRSGYNSNDMGAYMELRDERVCFFVRALARGKHSVSYRMRAEIPGKFSALPAKAHAMYAPELKANSDEIKLSIVD